MCRGHGRRASRQRNVTGPCGSPFPIYMLISGTETHTFSWAAAGRTRTRRDAHVVVRRQRRRARRHCGRTSFGKLSKADATSEKAAGENSVTRPRPLPSAGGRRNRVKYQRLPVVPVFRCGTPCRGVLSVFFALSIGAQPSPPTRILCPPFRGKQYWRV